VRKKKQFSSLTKRIFHPEVKECLTCRSRLKRFATLSQRIVITFDGAIQVVHCGYRCPNQGCSAVHRVYRSAEADALALPGFTFGLDVVILVGHLRLAKHQTVDEVHQTLQERLSPFHLTISRREVMYLFEAYCSLLRAAHQPSDDPHWQTWRAKVQENGGVIISIDGIQPDKGNETIYLVRDVLTGRVLCAENVSSSETEVMKQILSPVVKLDVPVLGVISDAQVSEVLAVAQLWPTVPHQTCQFHYLREATRPMYDLDQKTRTTMRKTIQNKLRETRSQVRHQLQELRDPVEPERQAEREQLQILADYATGIQTALNLEGNRPFVYPGLGGYDALGEVEVSLMQLEKKGARGADPSN
jgi:hypothetical protein